MRTVIGLLILLLNTSGVAAPTIGLASEVRTLPAVETVPGGYTSELLFVEQEVRVVTLLVDSSNAGVGNEWAGGLRWTFRNSEGAVQTVDANRARILNSTLDSVPGSAGPLRRSAEAILPALPVGDYTMRAEWLGPQGTVLSPPFRFSVRVGGESAGIRRVYLRYLADFQRRTETPLEHYRRVRDLMLQLAELEPTNPWVFEHLGDLSVGNAPVEDSLSYYAKARRTAETNLIAKYGSMSALPPDVAEKWQAQLARLTIFSRFAKTYEVGAGDRVMVVERAQKKSIMVVRGGKVVHEMH